MNLHGGYFSQCITYPRFLGNHLKRDQVKEQSWSEVIRHETEELSSLKYSNGGLYIGAGKNFDKTSFFSGLIDDVRIYDVALNSERIAALAQYPQKNYMIDTFLFIRILNNYHRLLNPISH